MAESKRNQDNHTSMLTLIEEDLGNKELELKQPQPKPKITVNIMPEADPGAIGSKETKDSKLAKTVSDTALSTENRRRGDASLGLLTLEDPPEPDSVSKPYAYNPELRRASTRLDLAERARQGALDTSMVSGGSKRK